MCGKWLQPVARMRLAGVALWRLLSCGGKSRRSSIDWGVHVLFILSVGLEVSRQFLLMV